jgi:hypothetical protein
MKRRAGCVLLLLAGGCLPGPEGATLVPCNPFITQAFTPNPVPHVVESPGTKEASDRVLAVGGKVIAANPQIGFRPIFCTIGSPKEEIIHRGTRNVFISEGLVRSCETEGQLAAVICQELGKMVAERADLDDPALLVRQDRSPIEVPVGNDSGGTFGSPDGTRRMELSKYVEQPRHRGVVQPPSPEALAREYLRRAGYPPADLDAAAPALKAAEEHSILEKIFTTGF